MEPLRELEEAYAVARRDPAFASELSRLLRDYVGRPTPLGLAARLSERLGCRVWLKREDLCHTGAHKINNALGQALLVKRMGKTRVVAETGAGQHGVATATVCALLGLDCVVYMGTEDMARQSPNVTRMRLLGRRGARGRLGHAHAQGRDQRGDARLGHERADDALPARVGPRRAPLPGDGAGLPGGDRPGGPRAGARGGRTPPRPAPRLRRRRLERDRALLRLPRGRGRADGGRRGRRPLGAARRARRAIPGRAGLGRRRRCAAGHADVPAAGRGRATCCRRTPSRRASTTRRSVPSTRSCTTRAGSSTPRSGTTRPWRRSTSWARPRASCPPSSRPTRWPGSSARRPRSAARRSSST